MGLKSLEKTFIYTHLNKSNGMTNNIAGLLSNGITLTEKNLEEPLMIIMKNFKFPLKYKVMEDFKSGNIILKYGTNTKLPTALPFFLTKNSEGRVVAVVSVDIYGTMNKETGDVSIDAKKLYCMMEAAYLSKVCFFHDKQLSARNVLLTYGSNIYSAMFTRVLNKKYALNLDKTKLHKVLLLSSKFYLINILGLPDSDLVFNYAIKNCPNGNLYSLEEANDALSMKDYENLETFIKALTKPQLGLNFKDLTVRNYLEAFINMYDASNLLSLEAFPYFIYNIISVTNGAYINNQYVLEDIVGSGGAKIYNDIMNLDK